MAASRKYEDACAKHKEQIAAHDTIHKQQIATLQTEVQNARDAITRLQTRNETAIKQVKEGSKDEIAKARAEMLEDKEKALKNLSDVLTSTHVAQLEAEAELREKGQKAEAAAHSKQMERLQTEHAHMQQKWTREKEELVARCSDAEKSRKNVECNSQSEIAILKQSQDSLQKDLATARNDAARVVTELELAQTREKQANESVLDLKQQLTEERSAHESQLNETIQETLSKSKADFDNREKSLEESWQSRMQKSESKFKAKLQKGENVVSDAQQVLETLNKDCADLREQLAVQISDNAKLKSEVSGEKHAASKQDAARASALELAQRSADEKVGATAGGGEGREGTCSFADRDLSGWEKRKRAR